MNAPGNVPSSQPPARLLIANRGEIAIRIARAADDLGLERVAVYAAEDHTAVSARDKSITSWHVDGDIKNPISEPTFRIADADKPLSMRNRLSSVDALEPKKKEEKFTIVCLHNTAQAAAVAQAALSLGRTRSDAEYRS